MRIVVVSDTHGSIEDFLKSYKLQENIDLVIFLGDCIEDAVDMKGQVGVPILEVRGNNDYFWNDIPWNEVHTFKGHRFLLTHGHKERVDFGPYGLVQRAHELDCEIVLYGHRHIFHDEIIDDVRLINPGSAGFDRGGEYESYVILDVAEDEVNLTRIRI